MSRKNLTRRRPREGESDTSLGNALSKAASKSARRSVIDEERNIVERDGPVQAVRRKSQGVREAVADPVGEAKVEVDLTELEALARMGADDLAALYDAQPTTSRLREGDRITATLVRKSGGEWLVDVGAKAEASLDVEELPRAQAGDHVDVWVIYTDGESVRVSTKLQGGIAASLLEEAAANDIPVEAKVMSHSGGGFTVRVGDQTGFVPNSHIDRLRGKDPDEYVGRTLQFLVLEAGDRIVLSRRRLQEQALGDRTETLWASLQPGDAVSGVVTRPADFGVFVDVDGVEGLIPRSAITSDREAPLAQTYPPGRPLELEVMRIDRDQKRIAFSVRGVRPQRSGPTQRPDKPAPSAGDGGFGTLGDLLGKWKG